MDNMDLIKKTIDYWINMEVTELVNFTRFLEVGGLFNDDYTEPVKMLFYKAKILKLKTAEEKIKELGNENCKKHFSNLLELLKKKTDKKYLELLEEQINKNKENEEKKLFEAQNFKAIKKREILAILKDLKWSGIPKVFFEEDSLYKDDKIWMQYYFQASEATIHTLLLFVVDKKQKYSKNLIHFLKEVKKMADCKGGFGRPGGRFSKFNFDWINLEL